jgi:hypothetical protein
MKIAAPTIGILLALAGLGEPARAMPVFIAENAVKQLLKDPDSAQFRNVKEFTGPVCGEVNSKNGFGGYVGFSKFIVVGSFKSPSVYLEGQSEVPFQLAWEAACR